MYLDSCFVSSAHSLHIELSSVARELIPIGKKPKAVSGESAESALLSHDIIKSMKWW